jgi:hypothetical protein
MTPRTKKLIGAILMLVWIVVYVVIAAAIGMSIAYHYPQTPWFLKLLYYALAGTLWIVPIGLMFPWMYREPR